MGLFRRKKRVAAVSDLSVKTRTEEILRLETERENINREIEKLLIRYTRLTGDIRATKGAKKIGKSKKDYSYWHEDAL